MGDNEYSELGRYIVALCQAQNLSLRQASMRSGLDPTTISKILQRDRQNTPTPETLEKIAGGLNGDYLRMMSLAGHLPPVEVLDGVVDDTELYTKIQRLQDLIWQVAQQDRDAAARLMGLVITPFEIMLALEESRAPEQVEEVVVDDKKVV